MHIVGGCLPVAHDGNGAQESIEGDVHHIFFAATGCDGACSIRVLQQQFLDISLNLCLILQVGLLGIHHKRSEHALFGIEDIDTFTDDDDGHLLVVDRRDEIDVFGLEDLAVEGELHMHARGVGHEGVGFLRFLEVDIGVADGKAVKEWIGLQELLGGKPSFGVGKAIEFAFLHQQAF